MVLLRPSRGIVLTACLALICSAPSALATKLVRFHGEANPQSAKFYWEVREWAPDWQGFVIAKKQEDRWLHLTSEPILPGLYYQRDWEEMGVAGDFLSTVMQRLEKLTRGGDSEKTPEMMLELLQVRGGLGTGDRIAMKNDFAVAVASGFGLVDRSYRAPIDQEYGLFVVREDGSIDETPIDRFETKEYFRCLDLAVEGYSLKFESKNVHVNWELSEETFQNLGVFGYYIYSRIAGSSDDWRKLTKAPIWGQKTDDRFIFEYVDTPEPHDDLLEYAVEPITVFQNKLAWRKLVVERPPEYSPPTDLSVARSDSYLYVLNWNFPDNTTFPETTLLEVERAMFSEQQLKELGLDMQPRDGDYEVAAMIDSSAARSWVDPLRISEPYHVFYRVTLVDLQTKRAFESTSLYKLLQPNIPPKPVSKLTARLMPKTDQSGAKVRLSWQEKAEDAPLTEYFAVASDRNSDEIIEHSSFQIEENFFELEVGDVRKVCTFRVTPIGYDNLEGHSREVKLYVPKLRLDPFPKGSEIEYRPRLNELASTISWEYGDRTDIVGFRIKHLESDEILADVDEVKADSSEWVWRGEMLKSEKRIPIQIEAVGVFDYITSLPKVAYLDNSPQHVKRNYSLPEVEFSEVSLYEDNGKRVLVLKWEPWDEELYGDVARLGLGPGGPDELDKVTLYRMPWHHYRETENGKLVVELPEDLEGNTSIRLVPLYPDEAGRPVIKGRFTEFLVDLDDSTDAIPQASDKAETTESKIPLAEALHWETRLIEEEASFSDEFMTGLFAFKNVGPNPIEIRKINSSCGCTTVQLDKRLYLPGESGEVVAIFEFEGRTGRQTKVVDVYVEGYEDPVRLILRTTIPKVLSIKPAFQTWESGEERTPKYSLLDVEIEESVKITAVESSDSRMKVELEEIEGSKDSRLKLTPEASKESFNVTVMVKTNYPAENPKSYPVKIQVR